MKIKIVSSIYCGMPKLPIIVEGESYRPGFRVMGRELISKGAKKSAFDPNTKYCFLNGEVEEMIVEAKS